jgi:hypothetical protein
LKAWYYASPYVAHGNLYCEHSEHEGEALTAFADGGGDASLSNCIVENIHQIAGLFKRIPQGVEGPQFQFLRSNYLEDLFAADKIFACEK